MDDYDDKLAKADELLSTAYEDLGITEEPPLEKFKRIGDIIPSVWRIAGGIVPHPTTGTISERLCELALKAKVKDTYHKLPPEWRWLGDFYIEGVPLNLIVSVKSFKARERLIASGTGSLLAPTLGFGLFDDPEEFSPGRVKSYLYRGFMAIYVPGELIDELEDETKQMKNTNGTEVIRENQRLPGDLEDSTSDNGLFDLRRL